MATMALFLVTGCSSDPDTSAVGTHDGATLQLLPLQNSYIDASSTRSTLPTGFSAYTGNSPIRLYFTSTTGEPVQSNMTFVGSNWQSDKSIEEQQQYYFYGYMPATIAPTAGITAYGGSFATGATLTLNGLPALTTTDDVCIVVGVGQSDETFNIGELSMGQFSYIGQSENAGNYAYLLLDHLYASLQVRIRVEADYNEMRTVKLKSMQLTATTANTYNATVSLLANDADITPVVSLNWTSPTGANRTVPLFSNETGAVLTTSYQDMTLCMLPHDKATNLTLVSIYDIYDTDGNLLREDCTSANHLSLNGLKRGEKTNLNLTVDPTYFHILSESDFDNPLRID